MSVVLPSASVSSAPVSSSISSSSSSASATSVSSDLHSAMESSSAVRVPHKFDIGDKVFAERFGLHEAKILEELMSEGILKYKVHYNGWNARYDEAVDATLLLPYNESNILLFQQQKEMIKRDKEAKRKKKKKTKGGGRGKVAALSGANNTKGKSTIKGNSDGGDSQSNAAAKKRKRKLAECVSTDGSTEVCGDGRDSKRPRIASPIATSTGSDSSSLSHSSHNYGIGTVAHNFASGVHCDDSTLDSLNIELPSAMKRLMIADWKKTSEELMLVDIPRGKGERVCDILEQYKCEKLAGDVSVDCVLSEVVRGLQDYFDQALEVTLLYRLERPRHERLKNGGALSDLPMSSVYGAEHLCRLFVKLPQLLSPSDLDLRTRTILRDKIHEIIRFLLENQQRYFNAKYRAAAQGCIETSAI